MVVVVVLECGRKLVDGARIRILTAGHPVAVDDVALDHPANAARLGGHQVEGACRIG